MFLSKMYNSHCFFVKKSRSFVGKSNGYGKLFSWKPWQEVYGPKYKYSFKDICYWPIAYIKFMWYCRVDW